MARAIDRTYKAGISDGSNLRLSQRGFRPISVDRLDRSGSLCSESLTDLLKTSVLPACEASSTERMQHTVVGSKCPIFDTRGGCACHDVDIGSQFAAVVVKRQIVDVVAEGVLDLGTAKEGSVTRKWVETEIWITHILERPRMMYAASMVPGMVTQSRYLYNWKGKTRTYAQVI